MVRLLPSRSTSRSCSTRRIFACRSQIHFGDFVEQQRAALGLLEFAGVSGQRAGEGALLVAEQSRLQHVLRDRRAIDGDVRLMRRAPNGRG